MKKAEKSIELGGRKLTLKTGVLAEQATGAVLASYGETVVLATVVASPLKVDLGYFPLTVEYMERLYAGGRIKGSRWVKREGRPSDEEILSARLIDRSIRPLFPETFKKDVQVILTILSVDMENDPSILSAIATSAALAVSSIPWKGPIGAVRVGMKDGVYFTNPVDAEMMVSEMDLVVSSTKEAVLMVEAGAKEVSEEKVLGGIEFAQKEITKIIDAIVDLAKEVGSKKEVVEDAKIDAKLVSRVKKLISDKIPKIVEGMVLQEAGRSQEYQELIEAVLDNVSEAERIFVLAILEKLKKEYVRNLTLSGKRLDGRKHTEIRKLSSQVSVLPRTHGSAIFQRGQTQVLTVATLGAPSLEQLLESAEGEASKRYMHHYSMPPYSLGETGRVGYPSRREIGHGALAERALLPVIPTEEAFPYAIRIVSEVMSSNGSTSMASVCGSTLALMDSGVPITSPVSGIAMGLVIEDKKAAILSDIIGMEDFNGDMDFKIAGTQKGITAMQLDVKTLSLTLRILKDALAQAKEGRALILKSMLETLPSSREKVSLYAPKIKVVKIPVEKIGELIGPGGKMIRKIISETGAQVEVEDDGSVSISASTDEALAKGVSRVEALTKEVVAGEIYEGEVKRIQPFGAFVEILPGKDGLVHVSDMADEFVKDPNEKVSLGDKVKVRVKEIDELGRINLSMRMDPSKDKPKGERREFRGGGKRFDYRGGGRPRFRDSRDSKERGGPHFPTSRLLSENQKDFNR